MPNCQKCNHKWTWKETFIRMFTFKSKLKCPSCKEVQYLSKKSRDRISMFLMIPFIIWVPLVSFNVPTTYTMAIVLFSYMVFLSVTPHFYELSNEEEPIWGK
ncbi:TIGR04104 family putative zinc finger protein [Priestia filamentosa]|uniref:TIGR04104 family putative zinc finger protein n=1 Tax=Priestia filamentosa TaxID=1402861 RepID=UPI0039798EF2